MWLILRNIYLKFEVDTLEIKKVIEETILLHKILNLKSAEAKASKTVRHNTLYNRANEISHKR
jgi:hypothetical protein